jgi:hypothetical protein
MDALGTAALVFDSTLAERLADDCTRFGARKDWSALFARRGLCGFHFFWSGLAN